MYFVSLVEIGHMAPERKELCIKVISVLSIFRYHHSLNWVLVLQFPTKEKLHVLLVQLVKKGLLYVLYNEMADMISI